MIIIECDGCYARLDTQEKILSAVTMNVEQSREGMHSRVVKTIHLCPKCKTTRRGIYVDNPFYVEPPEDAKSEQKASQGS